MNNAEASLICIKRPIRAVLLDVDGTLYHSRALRFFMTLELCALPLVKMSCQSACGIWQAIRSFRSVREELRGLGEPEGCLGELQYIKAAQRISGDPAEMASVVAEWIHRRPLKYLRLCRRCGLDTFFTFLENKGVQAGVFSDYPIADKLEVLGLSHRVSVALCATHPEINAFKPHPKGFIHACAIWGMSPAEVLYIGDRPEVDAVGAAADRGCMGRPPLRAPIQLSLPLQSCNMHLAIIFSHDLNHSISVGSG